MSGIPDAEVKAAILSLLEKKGRWGAHYFPLDTMINWLGRKVKRDGKRVNRCVEDLAKEGFVLLHKKGNTVSLNPSRSQEIVALIRKASGT
ncbi:hypothetical protein KEJ39_09435 [Candidatus Bathyarchaeota archaeon]|nr:hypothetical protein [Candidatus Bathyarchaeota archaeon]